MMHHAAVPPAVYLASGDVNDFGINLFDLWSDWTSEAQVRVALSRRHACHAMPCTGGPCRGLQPRQSEAGRPPLPGSSCHGWLSPVKNALQLQALYVFGVVIGVVFWLLALIFALVAQRAAVSVLAAWASLKLYPSRSPC